MPKQKTDEQLALELENEMAVRKALLQALPGLQNTQTQVLKIASSRANTGFVSAASAWSRIQGAIHSGDMASYRQALTDLALANIEQYPVDANLLGRIENQLDAEAGTAGKGPDSPERQKRAWELFVGGMAAPQSNPQVVGTYNAMKEKYGDVGNSISGDDPGLVQSLVKIQEKVRSQEAAGNQLRQGRNDLLDWDAKHPSAAIEDLQQYAGMVGPGLGGPTMEALEEMIQAGPGGVTYTKEEQRALDEAKAAQAKIMARVDQPLESTVQADTERDEMARVVAMPRFQEWAKSNGYDVGSVRAATPSDKDKMGANAITSAGVYVEGPDDHRAMVALTEQLKQGDDPTKWRHNPVMHRALGNDRRTYGYVQVVATPGEAGTPAQTMWHSADGDQPIDPKEVAYWLELEGAWYPVMLGEEDEKDSPRTAEQAKAAGALVETPAAGGAKQTTIEVPGQFLAQHAGDPSGSVRMLTAQGEKVYTREQLVGEPEVTHGGGEKQTLGAFREEVLGRVARNIAEKGKDTTMPVDRAAMTLVPEVYSDKEKEAAAKDQDRRDAEARQQREAKQRAMTEEMAKPRPTGETQEQYKARVMAAGDAAVRTQEQPDDANLRAKQETAKQVESNRRTWTPEEVLAYDMFRVPEDADEATRKKALEEYRKRLEDDRNQEPPPAPPKPEMRLTQNYASEEYKKTSRGQVDSKEKAPIKTLDQWPVEKGVKGINPDQRLGEGPAVKGHIQAPPRQSAEKQARAGLVPTNTAPPTYAVDSRALLSRRAKAMVKPPV